MQCVTKFKRSLKQSTLGCSNTTNANWIRTGVWLGENSGLEPLESKSFTTREHVRNRQAKTNAIGSTEQIPSAAKASMGSAGAGGFTRTTGCSIGTIDARGVMLGDSPESGPARARTTHELHKVESTNEKT